jgi:7tm Chemosensory receptor
MFEIYLQMMKLASTIANLQTEFSHLQTLEMRELLQSFYCQVRLKPITFTACNFFNIDLTLLASITTGIISYLIVLVQFYAAKS